MKKMNIVLYTAIVLTFVLVVSPLVSADPYTRLDGDVFIALNWDFVGFGGTSPYSFIGTVSGDIDGDLYISLTAAWFPAPGVEHFTEDWRIEPYSGGDIEGYNKGKWTMSNFKWIANGEVTGASSEWQHLIGSKWQYSGTTTEFPVEPPTPVTGIGKWHITHNK